MRFSIRHQVLVPIVAIQAVTLAAITIASVAMAARRTERQIIDRLEGVTLALGRSNFPLTEGVLARMHDLSGARFVAYDPQGKPLAASDPQLLQQAPDSAGIPVSDKERFGSLSDAPTITVSGSRTLPS